MKTNIFRVINTFYQEINNKIYIHNYALNLAKSTTSQYGEIKLLNSSYNIEELIENMIKSLTSNYKNLIQNKIKSNFDEAYLEIKTNYENQNWEKLIKEKIDEIYNTILFLTLKEVIKYDIGMVGYNIYDLNDDEIKTIK